MMDNRPEKTALPWEGETKRVVAETLGYAVIPKPGLGELAREYLMKFLPREISQQNNQSESYWKDRIGKSRLSAHTIATALKEMAAWTNFDYHKAGVFLQRVVPQMIAHSELNPAPVETRSQDLAYAKTAKLVGEGHLTVMTPACPPYDYCVDNSGLLKHASGRLLPSFGDRFLIVCQEMTETFGQLTHNGVNVSMEVWTYTGETGNTEDLVDLGADVQTHYSGHEEEMFAALKSCAQDAREKLDILSSCGIQTNLVSIERNFGSIIKQITDEYCGEFPDSLHDIGLEHNQEMVGNWLQEQLKVKEGWLMFFVEQETAYRKKQGISTQTKEPLVVASLREGLLYLLMTHHINQNGTIMFDLETTPDYVKGSLNHLPGPVILGASYDPNNPRSRFNIRQPFNTPVRL